MRKFKLRGVLLMGVLLMLLVGASVTSAQDAGQVVDDVGILLQQASSAFESDDVSVARALLRGADALVGESLADCGSQASIRTLLQQAGDATTADDAGTLIVSAQTLLDVCPASATEEPLALTNTFSTEYLSFDYPAGWVSTDQSPENSDALDTIYVGLADSQATMDAINNGNTDNGQAIFVSVNHLFKTIMYDPTDIDSVAENYAIILGVANYDYTIDVTRTQVNDHPAQIVEMTFNTSEETPPFGDHLTSIFMLETDPASTPTEHSSYIVGVTVIGLGETEAPSVELAQEILASVELNLSP